MTITLAQALLLGIRLFLWICEMLYAIHTRCFYVQYSNF